MPITEAQLITGSKYAASTLARVEPIDQINVSHKLLDWLIKNKQAATFANGSFREPLFTSNDSNYQNYAGADQVTYNERDPANWTNWTYYSHHDGFWFDEDRLTNAGIQVAEDMEAVATAAEKEALLNLVKVSYSALKGSIQTNLAYELYRDGSQSTKACPGLAHIIKTAPTTGTVGGIDAGTYSYWRNNANTAIAQADLVNEMHITERDCVRYGGARPTAIFAGSAFCDVYRNAAGLTVNRQINGGGNSRGGVSLDAGVTDLFFNGIPVIWDPTLDALDTLLGTTTWTKTAFMVSEKKLILRPVKGQWMVDRKPERLPDRYVYYFGRTSKYGLTTDQRNALAVLTVTGS